MNDDIPFEQALSLALADEDLRDIIREARKVNQYDM